MRTRFPGFATVRAVCYRCGWFRILGPTGSNGEIRALIRIEPARSSCNVLWSKVIEVPATVEFKQLKRDHPNYHDLQLELDYRRNTSVSRSAGQEFAEMTKQLNCPRCKKSGGIYVEVYEEYAQGRSQHIPCWMPPESQGVGAPL